MARRRGASPYFAGRTLAKMMRARGASHADGALARDLLDEWLRPRLAEGAGARWQGPALVLPVRVGDADAHGTRAVEASATGARAMRAPDGALVLESARIEARAQREELGAGLARAARAIGARDVRHQCSWEGEVATTGWDNGPAHSPREILGWGDPWCVPEGPAGVVVREAFAHAQAQCATDLEIEGPHLRVISTLLASAWRGLWRAWLHGLFGARTCKVHKLLLRHPQMGEGTHLLKLAGGTRREREHRLDWLERYPMSAFHVLEHPEIDAAVRAGAPEGQIWRRLADLTGHDAEGMRRVLHRQWPTRLPASVRSDAGRLDATEMLADAFSTGRWFVPATRAEWVLSQAAHRIARRLPSTASPARVAGTNQRPVEHAVRVRAGLAFLRQHRPAPRTEAQAEAAARASVRACDLALEGARAGGRYWMERVVDAHADGEALESACNAAAARWDRALWSTTSAQIADTLEALAHAGEAREAARTREDERWREEDARTVWPGPAAPIEGLVRAATETAVRALAERWGHRTLAGRWREGRSDGWGRTGASQIHVYTAHAGDAEQVLVIEGGWGERRVWWTSVAGAPDEGWPGTWAQTRAERWNAREGAGDARRQGEAQRVREEEARRWARERTRAREEERTRREEHAAYRTCAPHLAERFAVPETGAGIALERRPDPWEGDEIPF